MGARCLWQNLPDGRHAANDEGFCSQSLCVIVCPLFASATRFAALLYSENWESGSIDAAPQVSSVNSRISRSRSCRKLAAPAPLATRWSNVSVKVAVGVKRYASPSGTAR